jgi:hemolysin D
VLKRLLGARDDSHEFRPILAEIEDQPLNPMGRFVFWTIIGAIVFLGGWVCLGQVDVVVSGQGQVVPDGQVKVIQPMETGVVSAINCRPGDAVRKGDVLVEIDPSATAPTLESSREKLRILQIEVERLTAILANRPFAPDPAKYGADLARLQKQTYDAAVTGFAKLIAGKRDEMRKVEEQTAAARTESKRFESLLAVEREREARLSKVLDLIARDDYEKLRQEIINNEKGLEEQESKLRELAHQRSQLENDIAYATEDFRNKNFAELSDRRKQEADLRAEIERVDFMRRKQSLVSPVDGHVNEVFVTTVGGVVTPAEKLLTVVPQGTPLMVEALVLNKDIGFVEPGMSVTIKVDAFDFQKYGTLKGEVKHISRDSIKDEKLGQVYKVYVTPLEHSLRAEGREVSLSAGLTVRAEVNVGKRRIIEFFLYPLIKYLDEGLSVR